MAAILQQNTSGDLGDFVPGCYVGTQASFRNISAF